MAVNYVRPHYDIEKGDRRTLAFEISFVLTDEHEGLLPRAINDEWKHFEQGGCDSIRVGPVQPQKFTLAFTPEGDDRNLVIPIVMIQDATLSTVVEKGSGDAVEVTRLKFRAVAELTKDVAKFADFQYGKQLWMMLEKAQGSLFED